MGSCSTVGCAPSHPRVCHNSELCIRKNNPMGNICSEKSVDAGANIKKRTFFVYSAYQLNADQALPNNISGAICVP